MVDSARQDKLTVWENLVKGNWDFWDGKRRMVSYGL
jgi:hypothetical protein